MRDLLRFLRPVPVVPALTAPGFTSTVAPRFTQYTVHAPVASEEEL